MGNPHRIIVTCGPASEAIDKVRSITNFSTGELGSLLSDEFGAEGWDVLCLRGKGATFPPPEHAQIVPFSTNAELERLLYDLSTPYLTAVFHIAALCDFRLASIENENGKKIRASKFSSELNELRLILKPAPKIIKNLQTWYPKSRIVGWKYELTSSVEHAVRAGFQQIKTNKTHACVVNGRSFKKTFAFLEKEASPPIILPTKAKLCKHLKNWLMNHL